MNKLKNYKATMCIEVMSSVDKDTLARQAFHRAALLAKNGVACKLSREHGVWTCERIDIGEGK